MNYRYEWNADIYDHNKFDKIMSKTEVLAKGPKCFGTMKRSIILSDS
jgi:hypothetical protein